MNLDTQPSPVTVSRQSCEATWIRTCSPCVVQSTVAAGGRGLERGAGPPNNRWSVDSSMQHSEFPFMFFSSLLTPVLGYKATWNWEVLIKYWGESIPFNILTYLKRLLRWLHQLMTFKVLYFLGSCAKHKLICLENTRTKYSLFFFFFRSLAFVS